MMYYGFFFFRLGSILEDYEVLKFFVFMLFYRECLCSLFIM